MRAYVITGIGGNSIGIATSRRRALAACENYLESMAPLHKLIWTSKKKHTGGAVRGEYTTTFEMFFLNRDYQQCDN